MRAIFVTGTDTSVGKTVVSDSLRRYLKDRGYRVVKQKWIETGRHSVLRHTDFHLTNPYIFKFPSSPHLAARLENKKISADKIKKSFRALSKRFDFVIVEGIGGALVPISQKALVIDIAKELNLPVLIVVGNKLGAINHTLLTVEAIRKRNMKIAGMIFNNRFKGGNKLILKDNVKIIEKLTGVKALGVLPCSRNKKQLYKAFIPIGKKIIK